MIKVYGKFEFSTQGLKLALNQAIIDLFADKKLSHKDMTNILHISANTLYRYVRSGLLPRPQPQPVGWARFDGNSVLLYLPKLLALKRFSRVPILPTLTESPPHD
jgi:predicted DNA-binding transcriptional regulator AlpA